MQASPHGGEHLRRTFREEVPRGARQADVSRRGLAVRVAARHAVDQHQHVDALALRPQLSGDLERDRPADAVAPEAVRAGGLVAADLGEIAAGHLDEVRERLSGRLQGTDRLIPGQRPGEPVHPVDLSAESVDQVHRRSPLDLAHRHQGAPAAVGALGVQALGQRP